MSDWDEYVPWDLSTKLLSTDLFSAPVDEFCSNYRLIGSNYWYHSSVFNKSRGWFWDSKGYYSKITYLSKFRRLAIVVLLLQIFCSSHLYMVTFEEVLEGVSPELRSKLLFHLNLFT